MWCLVLNGDLFVWCDFCDGLYLFEMLKWVEMLMIYIDEVCVLCVLKCIDMFVCV